MQNCTFLYTKIQRNDILKIVSVLSPRSNTTNTLLMAYLEQYDILARNHG